MEPFQGFDGESSPANQTHGKAFFYYSRKWSSSGREYFGLIKWVSLFTVGLSTGDYCIIKYKRLIDFISATHFYFLLYWAKMGFDKSLANYVRVRRVCKVKNHCYRANMLDGNFAGNAIKIIGFNGQVCCLHNDF